MAKEVHSKQEYQFNPDGALWDVDSERAILAAGQRAILMQIAHPLVAKGVSDHSRFKKEPIDRLNHTLQLTGALVFGTIEDVKKAAKEINSAHIPVKGYLDETIGVHNIHEHYSARNPKLGVWVWATLVDSALVAREKFIGELTPEFKRQYYEEAKGILPLLKVDMSDAPKTYEDFQQYMEDMVDSGEVVVSDTARDLANFILLEHNPVTKFITGSLRNLTIGILPEKLRDQFGYEWNDRRQARLDRFAKFTQAVIPFIPNRIRRSLGYTRGHRAIRNYEKHNKNVVDIVLPDELDEVAA